VSALQLVDTELSGKLFLMAAELSKINTQHSSFRLVSNNGAQVGQSVFHVHLHFLAGTTLSFE
jgi:histidine triad (HIT) family protein